MSEPKNVLVAEDDANARFLLERTLAKGGYKVRSCTNGREALALLAKERFDALLTDWMMPEMDGMDLVRNVRSTIHPTPLIVMITALGSQRSRERALESGADAFVPKPYEPKDLLEIVKNVFERAAQQPAQRAGTRHAPLHALPTVSAPKHAGLCIAASTGGPAAVREFIRALPSDLPAAGYIVVHGAGWMLERLVQALAKETGRAVKLATEGMVVEPGEFALAPGEHHMTIEPETLRVRLSQGPPVNFVRPAADPMFASVAQAYGSRSVCVVLTGLGRDGTDGAGEIAAVGGMVLVQNPETAVAPSMPKSVLALGIGAGALEPPQLAMVVGARIAEAARSLAGHS